MPVADRDGIAAIRPAPQRDFFIGGGGGEELGQGGGGRHRRLD